MDLSQYAELFLAESREHLSACNQLLLEWEKHPSGLAPVGGLFRAVHTVKGMAATMGYARVTDLAHRMESLLDLLRRGAHPATDELLQLLFRARDALEHAVELSVVGRERELEVAEIVADLDHAASRMAPGGGPHSPGGRATPSPPPRPDSPVELEPAPGRLVQVTLRPEAPLKGGRALLVVKKAQGLGAVHSVTPSLAAFEADDFDGRFSLRLDSPLPADRIEAPLTPVGEVEGVAVGGDEALGSGARGEPGAAGVLAGGGRSRHIRVALRRPDGLMEFIGGLVTARGRLHQLAPP